MITENGQLNEQVKIQALALVPTLNPSGVTPAYFSMKNYGRATFLVSVLNGSTVTGSAITLNQATAVAGTSAKALTMTRVKSAIDVATVKDVLTAMTIVSDTFTTNATNSKNSFYVIEVLDTDLDVANGFDCVNVGVANGATNTTIGVGAILWGSRYLDNPPPSAQAD